MSNPPVVHGIPESSNVQYDNNNNPIVYSRNPNSNNVNNPVVYSSNPNNNNNVNNPIVYSNNPNTNNDNPVVYNHNPNNNVNNPIVYSTNPNANVNKPIVYSSNPNNNNNGNSLTGCSCLWRFGNSSEANLFYHIIDYLNITGETYISNIVDVTQRHQRAPSLQDIVKRFNDVFYKTLQFVPKMNDRKKKINAFGGLVELARVADTVYYDVYDRKFQDMIDRLFQIRSAVRSVASCKEVDYLDDYALKLLQIRTEVRSSTGTANSMVS
ncbi:unnamed protein product [Bursaphelenchus okinawaensis]|uniref:Uncharacterized protein n=1 Tax=Bursaphelenchus okinawaensis TaxID=465554 RepID=A0A811L6V5_9BILA|nr:unnamed protein product [Bursaphelenchus okinawaensis]CAG9119445.1 unnamed protein product [Bursaphelenchus okinawaensis]